MELLRLSKNSKMVKTAKKHGARLASWSIPAFRSAGGRITCPFAGECARGCYAQQGRYQMPNVKASQEKNLAETLRPEFVARMIATIQAAKLTHMRIHDSGDFYAREYRDKWIRVAQALPEVRFYAYTKSHDLFRGITLPANLTIVFSFGSTRDQAIDRETERHSIIIPAGGKLPRGYVDASDDDFQVFKGLKIALRYHGFRSRSITAGV